MINLTEQIVYLDQTDAVVEILNVNRIRFELLERTMREAFDGTTNVKISNTVGNYLGYCRVKVLSRRDPSDEYQQAKKDGENFYLENDNGFASDIMSQDAYVTESFKIASKNGNTKIDIKLELVDATASTKLYFNYLK